MLQIDFQRYLYSVMTEYSFLLIAVHVFPSDWSIDAAYGHQPEEMGTMMRTIPILL